VLGRVSQQAADAFLPFQFEESSTLKEFDNETGQRGAIIRLGDEDRLKRNYAAQ
jgi:hypothetical protein